MIKLTINKETIEVEKGTTILEAAKKLNYKIPTLCYDKSLSTYGGCRICVVEVEGERNLVPSCAVEARDGMVVLTHSEKVKSARQDIFNLLVANHSFGCDLNCLICGKSENCKLQDMSKEIMSCDMKFIPVNKELKIDNTSSSICREEAKCILCGKCVRACKELQHGGILTIANRGNQAKIATFMDKGIGEVDCVNCGQCINVCPTGAIHEVIEINSVLKALNDPSKHVVVQTAPAVRVALGEVFGLEPGVNVEKKMVTALRKLGFDKVFDTNFTADLTIMEEGSEFIHRLQNNGKLPLITSCSPGWIKFAEHNFEDCLDNLSTCKSPQQMFGALSKTYYPQKANIDPKDIVSVSIMPCTAKKFEAQRPEMNDSGYQDVDFVLTTRELGTLIKNLNIDFKNLEQGEYDAPFGISTGAAVIFGVTGGVMEAALRTAYEILTKTTCPDINFRAVRGLEGIKEAELDVAGTKVRVAIASGLENAYKLMQNKDKYHFIEIMGCPGGCINGGGQPFKKEDDTVEKRRDGIYNIDEKEKTIRKSHENKAVQKLYEEFLKEPLGEKSHHLLHTKYIKR